MGKTLLITGGTGSFGNAVAKQSLKSKILTVGIRPGEKIYETLINYEEMNRTISRPGHFVIKNTNNIKQKKLLKEYNSNNTEQLRMKDLIVLLKSLPEIKKLI